MRNLSISGTIKIAILYGIVFIIWIFFRNRIFYLWGKTNVIYSPDQTIIDLVFGFATALSIYFLIRYYKTRLLKETNELKNIIDNTTAVIFAKRKDGKYFFVNQHYEQVFDLKKDDVIGKTDTEIWPKEFAQTFITNDKKVFEAEKTFEYEETSPQKDGEHVYLTIKFPIRDLSGNVYAIGGIATDITHRKQMEKELKHSLALSKATLESTADGILVVSKDAKTIKHFNQNFIQMWDIPSELIESRVDKNVLEHVTKQLKDPQEFLSKVEELYDNPEKESFDVLKLTDGKTYERYSKPQISGDEIIGRVWSFRDITELVKNKETDAKRVAQLNRFQNTILTLTKLEIEMSLEEKLDCILKMTSKAVEVERVSIWLYNDAHTSLHARKIFILEKQDYESGYTFYKKDYPNYFSAIEASPIINSDDVQNDPRLAELSNYFEEHIGISSLLETPIRIGGKIIGLLSMGHIGSKRKWSHEEQVFSSSIAGIVAVSIEHNERQKAENKIRQSEEKYRFLAETVPHLLWTSQPDGTTDFFNSKVFQYTGMNFDELKKNWKDIVHPDDRNTLHKVLTDSIKTEKAWQLEYRLLGKDKKYRWFLGNAIPQTNSDGKILKWFGSLTDINEQKKSIELMNHKNEELMRTNNDLDNFIYTASHDLKAPISNIEGLTNILKEEAGKNDNIKSVLTLMEKSTERFKKTIEGLTDVAKVQKSGDEKEEEISFENLFEEVISDINEIKNSNAKITTDFSQSPTIYFSRKNLRSIIYNLLSNAIKYSSPDRTPKINVSSENTDDYTHLSIKDNGLGIAMDNKDKVFKMFKRLHTHTEGTGIGLYIVKRIMDNEGGKIEIESKVNEGTTFNLYFKRK